MDLNFLTEKVCKYQEKKLNDALQTLKLHQDTKKQLETELKASDSGRETELAKHVESIEIWKKNVAKIKEDMAKLQN